jgi:hypothetical protein
MHSITTSEIPDITTSALLVEMNISVWIASKLDRSATNDVINDSGATHDAAQVRKNLMAGTLLRKKIANYAAGCRLWHNQKTLPWSDKGPRLLASSYALDYMQEAGNRKVEFESMVAEFVHHYPVLLQQAPSNMGKLYDPNDYPSVEEVGTKFGFKAVYSPVPRSGDFRIAIQDQAIEQLRDQYEDAYASRLKDAMHEPWEQLKNMLVGMSEKLTESSDPDAKKRWHDSFLGNAQEMCDMLRHFNITGDPDLASVERRLRASLLGVDIEGLKDSATERAELKSRLDAMLGDYDQW